MIRVLPAVAVVGLAAISTLSAQPVRTQQYDAVSQPEQIDSTTQATTAAAKNVDAFEVAEELTAAVAEAKLPEGARKRVIKSVKEGAEIAAAVAEEVAYIKQVSESLKVEPEVTVFGRVVENAPADEKPIYEFAGIKVGA